MATPILGALIIGGTAMQAVGQAKSAKASKEAGAMAKAMAYEDAERMIETTRESADLLKRDVTQFMGKQVAGYASSGVKIRGEEAQKMKGRFTSAAEGLISTEDPAEGLGGTQKGLVPGLMSKTFGEEQPEFERPKLKGFGDMDTPLRVLLETGTRAAGDVSRMMEEGFSQARRMRMQGEQYQAQGAAQASAQMWNMGSTLMSGLYKTFDVTGWLGS